MMFAVITSLGTLGVSTVRAIWRPTLVFFLATKVLSVAVAYVVVNVTAPGRQGNRTELPKVAPLETTNLAVDLLLDHIR